MTSKHPPNTPFLEKDINLDIGTWLVKNRLAPFKDKFINDQVLVKDLLSFNEEEIKELCVDYQMRLPFAKRFADAVRELKSKQNKHSFDRTVLSTKESIAIQKLQDKLIEIDNNIQDNTKQTSTSLEDMQETEKNIKAAFEFVRCKLDQREEMLLRDLNDASNDQFNILQDQQNNFEECKKIIHHTQKQQNALTLDINMDDAERDTKINEITMQTLNNVNNVEMQLKMHPISFIVDYDAVKQYISCMGESNQSILTVSDSNIAINGKDIDCEHQKEQINLEQKDDDKEEDEDEEMQDLVINQRPRKHYNLSKYQKELVIFGYMRCMHLSTYSIPAFINKLCLAYYDDAFYIMLFGSKLTQFLNSKPGASFEVCFKFDDDFRIKCTLYPNGNYSGTLGFVQLFLNIEANNERISKFMFGIHVNCIKPSFHWKSSVISSLNDGTVSLPDRCMKLTECRNAANVLRELIFSIYIDIEWIEYTDKAKWIKPLRMHKDISFGWEIDEELLAQFRKCETGKLFISETSEDGVWCLECYPNGQEIDNANSFELILKLLRIPFGIKQVEFTYSLQVNEFWVLSDEYTLDLVDNIVELNITEVGSDKYLSNRSSLEFNVEIVITKLIDIDNEKVLPLNEWPNFKLCICDNIFDISKLNKSKSRQHDGYTKKQMQQECKKHKLPYSGKKKNLVKRLKEHYNTLHQ